MHNKWISSTPTQTAPTLVVANQQFDPTPVIKTIFEQLEKPFPDRRSLDDRILEKSASIARRLTK